MRELTEKELKDILYGCTILGTGGGGSLEEGLAKVSEALAAGKKFRLADFSELEPDSLVACPYSCGAISPLSEEEIKKFESMPKFPREEHSMAIAEVEKFAGKPVDALISTELGGGNTAVALYCAAMTGKLIADGDPAGRSVPGLQHSTYYIHNVPMCPIATCTPFGETAIFTSVVSDERAEDLIRALAAVSQNSIAVCDHVNTAKVIGDSVIRGAISHAERVGRAFLDAKAAGGDYAAAAAEAGGGRVAFRGIVESNDWETRDGYTFGTMVFKGRREYAGNTLKIWYQNENIISWLNGEYFVTVPELMCVFNDDERMPQLNPYAKVGSSVTMAVLPADPEWTSPRGMELFGPRSFGHDVDFVPYIKK